MGPLVKGKAPSSVMNVLCLVENDRRAQGVGLERTHHEEMLAIACNREVVGHGPLAEVGRKKYSRQARLKGRTRSHRHHHDSAVAGPIEQFAAIAPPMGMK